MSSNLATARIHAARPEPLAPLRQQPRHIEVVATRAQRRARPKLAYAIITIASLFGIFAAQLLLSIVVADGAYQVSVLQDQQKDLLRTQDALTEKLNVLDSTQNLSAQAAHLGMVPNAYPYAIDLGTGSTYALPGSADPAGCGGQCNLITNTQLAGVPLVDPNAPAASTGHAGAPAATSATPAQTEQAPVDSIPAPVTH
ncbi:MAG: hypothetical protein KKH51_00320 [Actinobacteria bacterium]|nr:hypothetical protein [Actinomycetota bacterium]